MALLYILTAGSKSDLLHSLHRCRILQRRSQEASWKLLEMHQPRRPEMGDGTSRSPSHPLPTQPDTAVYPDRWKQVVPLAQSATRLHISWIAVLMSGESHGYLQTYCWNIANVAFMLFGIHSTK